MHFLECFATSGVIRVNLVCEVANVHLTCGAQCKQVDFVFGNLIEVVLARLFWIPTGGPRGHRRGDRSSRGQKKVSF